MDGPLTIGVSRAFVALFPCRLNPARALVPPPLDAVAIRGEKGVVLVAAFEHEDSSLGAWKHVMIGIACRHKPWFTPPLGALMLERRSSDYGYYVPFAATSSEAASQALSETWGEPSFVADINVALKKSKVRFSVEEKGVEVLRFDMKRPGEDLPLHFPLRVYCRQGQDVLRSEMSVDAIGREKSFLASASVVLQRHERVESLRMLEIDADSPLEVRWYDSFRGRMDAPTARYRVK
jgi:hypothetical protein